MIAFDEEDPATVWCRLVWHRAWQLFAPEVGCYQGNEWIGNICGRVAKVLEAEAALVELETAGPLPQAAGTAKDQSTLVDDPDIPLSPAKLADRLGIPPDDRKAREALRKRLESWRKANLDGGWIGVEDPKPREPKYLYSVGKVWPLIEDLRPSG